MFKSDNINGALLMTASMMSFVMNDTLLKTLAGQVPLFQILFLRGCYTIVLTGFLAWYMGAFSIIPSRRDVLYITVRMLAEAGAAYFFLTALFRMPLANVTAILQAVPLLVTLAAAVVFGEQIGWRRLFAIVIGFTGVMMIVRPGADDFTIYSIYALIAVFCVTIRDLATRKLTKQVPSTLVTFTTATTVTVVFGVLILGQEWQEAPRSIHLKIMGTAILVSCGYIFSIMAMRVGEMGFVTPFRYFSLIWALIMGWLVFGDWPRGITLTGAVIVVASGLFTLYREARLHKLNRTGK